MVNMIAGIIVLYALFFLICFLGTGGDSRNMISYYSYPDAVQEKVKENPELRKMIPRQKSQFMVYLSNIIMFSAAFSVLGAILKIRQFFPALFYFLIAGEGLNLFDLLVIDMCWWRNTSRTKFKDIPEKTLYLDMTKHIASFVRGIPVLAISALISAVIMTALVLL